MMIWPQGLPHRHVHEQDGGGDEQRAHGDQRREQLRIVEQRVGAGFEQEALVAGAPRGVASGEGEDDEPQVRGAQSTAQVRENHG